MKSFETSHPTQLTFAVASKTRTLTVHDLKALSDIIKTIHHLAITYGKSTSLSGKYSKYGYDFPAIIEAKINLLTDYGGQSDRVAQLQASLEDALSSPSELIRLCKQYLGGRDGKQSF